MNFLRAFGPMISCFLLISNAFYDAWRANIPNIPWHGPKFRFSLIFIVFFSAGSADKMNYIQAIQCNLFSNVCDEIISWLCFSLYYIHGIQLPIFLRTASLVLCICKPVYMRKLSCIYPKRNTTTREPWAQQRDIQHKQKCCSACQIPDNF